VQGLQQNPKQDKKEKQQDISKNRAGFLAQKHMMQHGMQDREEVIAKIQNPIPLLKHSGNRSRHVFFFRASRMLSAHSADALAVSPIL
jgi:hypothetical protein